MRRVVEVTVLLVTAALAAGYVTIFDGSFPVSAGKAIVRNFTLYKGDSLRLTSVVLRGNDISRLTLSDAAGNIILSRYAYPGGSETVTIPATGFYVVKLENTAVFLGKTYQITVTRFNADSTLMSKSVAYVTKTVCDTTWFHFIRSDTLGVIRVDTAQKLISEKDIRLTNRLGSNSVELIGPIAIPAVTYAPGFEPTVVFYAANKESDRSLADALGNVGIGLALSYVGLGALTSAVDLSKVAKGEDFAWQLKQWALRRSPSEWLDYNVSNRVKIGRELIPYSVAVKYDWAVLLDNSSWWTNKVVTARTYLVQCVPTYSVVSRPDSTINIVARQVPVLPEEK